MDFHSFFLSKLYSCMDCITTKISLKERGLSDSSSVIVFFVMFHVRGLYPITLSPPCTYKI